MNKNKVLSRYAEEDYYYDSIGNLIFTAKYHEKRGYCCKQKCKHCPWDCHTY
ncbi:MAG: DUF5522 domain-containing protein [Thermoflexibacter sp.]|nr:DUF5522 domain-containing protein [Thermoflexibacter sp.]